VALCFVRLIDEGLEELIVTVVLCSVNKGLDEFRQSLR
jgi:hypothetical protein